MITNFVAVRISTPHIRTIILDLWERLLVERWTTMLIETLDQMCGVHILSVTLDTCIDYPIIITKFHLNWVAFANWLPHEQIYIYNIFAVSIADYTISIAITFIYIFIHCEWYTFNLIITHTYNSKWYVHAQLTQRSNKKKELFVLFNYT